MHRLSERAKLEGETEDPADKTFSVIVSRYKREVLPTKALRTRRDNEKELVQLQAVFGQVPIDSIQPSDVRTYVDLRGQTAKVRANRESCCRTCSTKREPGATPAHRTLAPGSRDTAKPGAIGM